MKNNIQSLIDKYWNGESTLAEEQSIKDYLSSGQVSEDHQDLIPLFSYFEMESGLSLDKQELDLSFVKEEKSKVRHLMPKVMGIAASLLFLLTVSFQFLNPGDDGTMYKSKYTEVEDPEHALEIAMDALGMLGKNYSKGTKPMSKGFKGLQKTDVFKFDKK